MSYSSTYDGFFDAKTARDIAIGGAGADMVVLEEINEIRFAVAQAALAGDLSVEITGTTITSADNYNGAGTSTYYDAMTDPYNNADSVHVKAREVIARVTNYMVRNGYTIRYERDGINSYLKATIKW